MLANVNRAVGSPWNIFADQNDSLSQRDTGWIQYYCENNQEVLDTIVQAFKVAERVLLPAMVCLDAFFLSHTSEPVSIPDAGRRWTRTCRPSRRSTVLSPDDPHAFGGLPANDGYMELRANDRGVDAPRRGGRAATPTRNSRASSGAATRSSRSTAPTTPTSCW